MKTIIIFFVACAILGAIIGFGRNREDSFGRFTRLLWFLYKRVLPFFIFLCIVILILHFFHII